MLGRGKILRVDLSREKISTEEISEELARNYIGGEGINTYLLWEHFLKVDPNIDPLDKDNVIIWGLGPLGGTSFGAGCKSRWTFKGPAYGILGDSTSGGRFGAQIRWAGYDHLVITGKAKKPVYIFIENDKVEIRDAGHLWGKKVGETDDLMKKELGEEFDTAIIGPAGENLVTYASIMVSRDRAAARTGAGAVFGSKNLKGIAAHGTKGITIHDRQAFFKATNALLTVLSQGGGIFGKEHFLKYGALGSMIPFNDLGWNTYRNGQKGQSPWVDKISAEWYFAHMQQRSMSCSPGCTAACAAWHHIKGDETAAAGRYTGEGGFKPEYGMVNPFGVGCDIPDLPTVAHLCHLCNEYGIDVIETGTIMSFLMELWQRGILTQRDMIEWTGEPLSLDWGNYESIEKIIEMIGTQRNKLGQLLKVVGCKVGEEIEELKGVPAKKFANYGKGGSPQGESMRSRADLSFAAAVAAVGGHHLKGLGIDEKSSMSFFGKPDAGYNWSYNLKGAGQAVSEIFSSMYNALGVCKFGGGGRKNVSEFPPALYTPALSALTPMKITPEELYAAGDRTVQIQKAFNSRIGLRREDDSVCYRWMYEPMPDGPGKGMKMEDFLEEAKDEYYEWHGWDKKTSLPKRETLEKLGLKDVADVLEKEGALA